jgi:hypothetical protein
MVLLCNDNPLDIKKNHMLKCLNKKKENFNIFIVPLDESLKKTLKEENTIIDQNIDINLNLNNKEIENIIKSFQKIEK